VLLIRPLQSRLSRFTSLHLFAISEEMARRNHLGNLELMVMLVLIRLGDEAYGVSISRELAERIGREVALGSVYASLERLEGKGLVSSVVGEPTRERGGRAKRYFRLNPKGLRQVRETQRALKKLWQEFPQIQGAKA
jgi:PadR family transcriptional regulator PadR